MDGSTNYIFSETALKTISSLDEGVKCIILLRNPTERVFSAWLHLKSEGREKKSLEEGLRLEEERIKANYEYLWRYTECSNYPLWISQLLCYISKDDVLYIDNRELKDIEKLKIKVSSFLNLTLENFRPQNKVQTRNLGGLVRNRLFHTMQTSNSPIMQQIKRFTPEFVKKKSRRINYYRPKLSKYLIEYLDDRFKSIRKETYSLTGIEL